jgi:hypothetical protein
VGPAEVGAVEGATVVTVTVVAVELDDGVVLVMLDAVDDEGEAWSSPPQAESTSTTDRALAQAAR